MSLYDDLGVGASDTKTEGWSKNFKLLQSQLKVKKAALTQAKVNALNALSMHTQGIEMSCRQDPQIKQNLDCNCTTWALLFFVNYSQHTEFVCLSKYKALSCCRVNSCTVFFFCLLFCCQKIKLYWPIQWMIFFYPWLETGCVHLAEYVATCNQAIWKNIFSVLIHFFCHCV